MADREVTVLLWGITGAERHELKRSRSGATWKPSLIVPLGEGTRPSLFPEPIPRYFACLLPTQGQASLTYARLRLSCRHCCPWPGASNRRPPKASSWPLLQQRCTAVSSRMRTAALHRLGFRPQLFGLAQSRCSQASGSCSARRAAQLI